MKITKIIRQFKAFSYKVSKDFSGKVVVTTPQGFKKSFSSYNAAYAYYFS